MVTRMVFHFDANVCSSVLLTCGVGFRPGVTRDEADRCSIFDLVFYRKRKGGIESLSLYRHGVDITEPALAGADHIY